MPLSHWSIKLCRSPILMLSNPSIKLSYSSIETYTRSLSQSIPNLIQITILIDSIPSLSLSIRFLPPKPSQPRFTLKPCVSKSTHCFGLHCRKVIVCGVTCECCWFILRIPTRDDNGGAEKLLPLKVNILSFDHSVCALLNLCDYFFDLSYSLCFCEFLIL